MICRSYVGVLYDNDQALGLGLPITDHPGRVACRPFFVPFIVIEFPHPSPAWAVLKSTPTLQLPPPRHSITFWPRGRRGGGLGCPMKNACGLGADSGTHGRFGQGLLVLRFSSTLSVFARSLVAVRPTFPLRYLRRVPCGFYLRRVRSSFFTGNRCFALATVSFIEARYSLSFRRPDCQ